MSHNINTCFGEGAGMVCVRTMRRFFNSDSFWNQPIGDRPAIDPESESLLRFMSSKDDRGFWINLHKWTIPIYEVDRRTARRKVHQRLRVKTNRIIARSEPYLHLNHPFGHCPDFAADARNGLVPIPDHALSDPESDHHISLVDWDRGWAWDMWSATRRLDGDWDTNSGIKYRIDGSGVFDRDAFPVHNGESIHPYGPCRAAGVPALAGTIMHQEILEGRIEHKLAFATQAAGLQRFVSPPAAWTDGGWRSGIPEGAVVQLDPSINLDSFNLSPAARVVARALQEYGAACVDVSGGHCLYGEGLYADPQRRTWRGLLDGNDLIQLKLWNYRVLEMNNVIHEGQGPRVPDGVYAGNE